MPEFNQSFETAMNTSRFDLLIRGGTAVTATGTGLLDIGISGGRIAAIGANLAGTATREIDATGRLVLPGGVDTHCHIEQVSGAGLLNADTFWVDRGAPNLAALGLAWDGSRMDILLMLADPANATGHSGRTDFLVAGDRALTRSAGAAAGMIYAGAAIIHPRIFAAAAAVPHSLNRYFDAAIADHRLFGMPMDGHWITVGTPDAIVEAEAALGRLGAS